MRFHSLQRLRVRADLGSRKAPSRGLAHGKAGAPGQRLQFVNASSTQQVQGPPPNTQSSSSQSCAWSMLESDDVSWPSACVASNQSWCATSLAFLSVGSESGASSQIAPFPSPALNAISA